VGQATRLIEYLVSGQKQYRATFCFGLATDTLDAAGRVLAEKDITGLTEARLRQILPSFVGDLDQIPPLFSAIKKDGQPWYKRARAGQTAELQPRRVTIHAITWVAWQPPHLTLDITCSAGTYIRALARDWGEAAGTGAHLSELIRTASGSWRLEEAISLEQLESDPDWQRHLSPLDQAISHLPQVFLSEEAVVRVKQGQQIQLDPVNFGPETKGFGLIQQLELSDSKLARVYTPDGDFLAILTLVQPDAKLWQPKKVLLN
jgi:tRNA pseudouridine55 synthase